MTEKNVVRLDLTDMEQFYKQKQYLASIDATPLLDQSIALLPEIGKVYDKDLITHRISMDGEPIISTAMLMEKLDNTVYMWRELNPEIVRLLSKRKTCRRDLVKNWIKGIQYWAPKEQLEQQKGSVQLLGV